MQSDSVRFPGQATNHRQSRWLRPSSASRTGSDAPRWSRWLDMLILLLLPLLSCIDLASGGKLSRVYYSMLLIGVTMIKLILFPALSLGYSRAQGEALRYLFSAKNKLWLALVSYIFLLIIAHMRAIYAGYMPLGAFVGVALWSFSTFLFVYLAFTVHARSGHGEQLVIAMFAGLALFILVNFAVYKFGLRGAAVALDPSGDGNRLMSLVGKPMARLSFPISSGPTAFGPIAGMLASAALCMLFYSHGWPKKSLGIPAFLLGLLGMFLVDSRSALVCVPLALFATSLMQWRRIGRRGLMTCVAILPIVPLAMIGIVKLVSLSDIASLFQRQGHFAQKLGIASGRENIWVSVLDVFSQFDPVHVVGYGAFGQIVSGASKNYSWLFNQIGPASTTAHNAALQVLLDIGYLGLVIWLWMIYEMLQRTQYFHRPTRSRFIARLLGVTGLYYIVTGFFDASTNFYQADTFPFFIAFLAVLIASDFFVDQQAKGT